MSELPIELNGVADALACDKGFWRTCSGCHESNEGVPTGPYSQIMKCHLGGGCFECGGIGAVWDTTDYADMGRHIAGQCHGIFVEESREIDSGSIMGFFARGHYERHKFAEACNEYTGADPYYDRRYVRPEDARHEWWRTVPVSGEPGVVAYHSAEPHSRGAFAVTVTTVVEDAERKHTQRQIDEHNKGRAAGFADGLNWALRKLDRINADAGDELLRQYRERDKAPSGPAAANVPNGGDHG